MSIRQSLLAILDQGPCYGYQLRLEFERRTGGTWPLNVGQVYATLDRLERDGFVTKSPSDKAGHVYYAITDTGRAEVRAWLTHAVEREISSRDELAVKLAIAITLPGADAASLISAQREVTSAALARYRAEPVDTLARQLVVDSLALAAEAELSWLDHCERLLGESEPFGLEVEPPKRGRPVATR